MRLDLKRAAQEARLEINVWAGALLLFVVFILLMKASEAGSPVFPGSAEEARAMRADYLSPWHLFLSGVLAPLIETWLIVKGVDALHDLNWRGGRTVLVVALVAAVLHYFARGGASALYNAAFFGLMARIYARGAYLDEKRGENRPASILLILLMHLANNAVALGMIGIYSAPP
jgi:hypothetical protein